MGYHRAGRLVLLSAVPRSSLLGDVGFTTVSGTDARTGAVFPIGENIYGPFEAGFGAQQNSLLAGLGCSNPTLGHVPGGIDTQTAEQMIAYGCGITLPRTEQNQYISIIDECGGHTSEYHFHERMSCLYTVGTGHSTKIGQAADAAQTPIYGKFEATSTLPLLDACGAHFGPTPDSGGADIYHHHVQDRRRLPSVAMALDTMAV